jgi:hypothetical protein
MFARPLSCPCTFSAPSLSVRIELELFAGAAGPWRHDLVVTTERSVFKLPVTADVNGFGAAGELAPLSATSQVCNPGSFWDAQESQSRSLTQSQSQSPIMS